MASIDRTNNLFSLSDSREKKGRKVEKVVGSPILLNYSSLPVKSPILTRLEIFLWIVFESSLSGRDDNQNSKAPYPISPVKFWCRWLGVGKIVDTRIIRDNKIPNSGIGVGRNLIIAIASWT